MTPDLELDKASATAALTPPARRMHRYLLTRFADTGQPSSRADLQRFAHEHDIDPHATLAELAERDVAAFQDNGELRAAYPFSPQPTAITVAWADGPTVYSMCAIDALGMSAMLDRPVVITATEPDSGEVVIVEVDHHQATWIPDTAAVFGGSTDDDCCPSVDRTCGNINFFTTETAAQAWAARNPHVTGAVLDQNVALSTGITEFGDMIR
ncbi:MAG: alkylmercury lyase family protein [Thermocrispum sp.]